MALILKRKSPQEAPSQGTQKQYPEVILLDSFTQPGVQYQVDFINKTCSCEAFATKGDCKHMEYLGVYKEKAWQGSCLPSFSQALSGLVKSIRLRNIHEALYWLHYLEQSTDNGAHFRTARRLLIGSAEDGHSIAVMERVSRNFPHLASRGVHFMEMAAEVIRICKIPNWWHPDTNGPHYIKEGMIAYRRLHAYEEGTQDYDHHLSRLAQAVKDQDTHEALFNVMAMAEVKGAGRTRVAQDVQLIATQAGVEQAQRLIQIHLNNKSALSGDENFICQSVWWACGNVSPVGDAYEPILAEEVRERVALALESWRVPHMIPGWCCDGIHCGGADKRFAGYWLHMNAACNAYKHFGELNPHHKWLQEFYDLDGMKYTEVK